MHESSGARSGGLQDGSWNGAVRTFGICECECLPLGSCSCNSEDLNEMDSERLENYPPVDVSAQFDATGQQIVS